MTRFAAFLRGVNVGGVNLKMAEVAAALTDAGFGAVRTVLASGNVLLDSDSGADAVRATAEAALRQRFGYDAWVLVYPIATVRAVVDAYPFPPEVDGYHSYVTFVVDDTVLAELVEAGGSAAERVAGGDGVLYWQTPVGSTLDSAIGKAMAKKRYKSSITTRNLRTLAKVLR